MGAKSHVSKWGNSLAIRIPKTIAEQWGVGEGSAIEIVPRGDRLELRKKVYDLTDMLGAIGPGNLHPEVETGPVKGGEAW